MQSGRVAQGLKQLLKPRATKRTERRLVDPLMNAKNDGVGRVIEEPRPDNVTNTGLDYKIIIPLVAAENGLGQAFGKPQPTPGWGCLELREQLIAPVKRRPQRLVPRQSRAAAAPQQLEAI